MKPLAFLITEQQVEQLASRSHFRYGKEIAAEGKIIIEKANSFNLVAKVKYKNGESHTTNLMTTSKGLRWKCTCTGKKDLFCKHCVALALCSGLIQ